MYILRIRGKGAGGLVQHDSCRSPPSGARGQVHDRLLVLIWMQPDAVDRLPVVGEDVLAAIVGPVVGSRCAVRELALAELHALCEVGHVSVQAPSVIPEADDQRMRE